MRPTAKDVHVDTLLQNVSVKYRNGLYIADMIAPTVSVKFQSNKYVVWNKGDSFRDNAQKRAPGTSSKRHGFKVSTGEYYCEEYAISTELPDEVKRNADSILRLESSKTQFVTDQILLRFERIVADLCTTGSNWGSNTSSPSVKWDDHDNSDPLEDIETAKEAIESTTGKEVNRMVISYDVWRKLKRHPLLLASMPNNTVRSATIELLKQLTEIPDIKIGRTLVNTANPGQTTDVFTRVWTKDVWLGHVTNGPAIDEPTALYNFVWPDEAGQIRGVRRWREEAIHSDVIEAFTNTDVKVVCADLGYALTSCIS